MRLFKFHISVLLLSLACTFLPGDIFAQESVYVQIKIFDLELNQVPDLEFVIDDLKATKTGNNGIVFQTIPEASLPPGKVEILNTRLEAESWNYSRGILEIIVREKRYRNVSIKVINKDDETPLPNMLLSSESIKSRSLETDSSGVVFVDIPDSISLNTPGLFAIEGYNVTLKFINEAEGILLASKITIADKMEQVLTDTSDQSNQVEAKNVSLVQSEGKEEFNDELTIEKLDSINSLTLFFSLIKTLNYNEMDSLSQKRIDQKFYDLSNLNTLTSVISTPALSLISDSSIINDDLLVLIEKIEYEAELLGMFRKEFETAASQIKIKLSEGGINLGKGERQMLIQLIINLKELLRKNEEQFYTNNAYYKSEIEIMQKQLSDILNLEDQLMESEESKKKYREQLIYTTMTLAALIGLVLLLIFLIRIFSSQRKELQNANNEIEKINNNLEGLVAEKTKSLKIINNELDTFLYRSSHNLRRPITSIKGLANVAAISLDKEGVSLFEKVTETSDEMEKMIDKLSMMNHINRPVDFGLINFEDIYQKIEDKYAKQIKDIDIALSFNTEQDLSFKSYPIVMELIFRNIIENSILYSRYTVSEQPQINITVKSDRGKENLNISVRDNGCGIEKDIRKKIWDMFFVGNVVSNGNGLGLYITKKAVESINGTIKMKTKVGSYCQFDVKLPLNHRENNHKKV